ncbi:hypothetical protein [Sphingobacterium sp. ML3W]|uniref:hypothetical protein n=1 Tax=Sphingobacterium sp. ML3W TaxID=1538644 RepID=UPI000A5B4880|nr:hypothetical protein [Sphingobacterium sp. ML3W]
MHKNNIQGSANTVLYAIKKEQILELEKLSKNQNIDLYNGDESHFSSEDYVPYG